MGSNAKYAIICSSIAFDGSLTALAHQLPRAVGSAPGLAAVPAPAARHGPHGQHCGCLVHQPAGRSTITPYVTARPPSSSSRVRRGSNCCVPSTFQGSSIVQPTRSHDSSCSLENGDSIPRQSGWSGVDSGKLRWTCLLPTTPPTASCITPWPRPPLHGHAGFTAGLGLYASTVCVPPSSLLAQTLCKVREDEVMLLATASPWRIPLRQDLLSQGLGTIWQT